MTDAAGWRERFLTVYEAARSTGDVDALAELLAPGLRLEDPQLPGGAGTRADLLRLTADLASRCTRLAVRRHGPVCVSADGGVFTQRWFVEAEPAEGAGAVHVETFESFTVTGGLVGAVAICVRDLRSSDVRATV
ncbi:nuclear transport factor 2 family protein [Jiangella alba]|uniref:SnoaL-like domain-containing protein n=1 Tax=Jiangella alba TaxID=561176 RepID=A0A1H5Q098_9ACTN|nr:nuclear transport factor 2 family protein [Jiangella alba]SEF18871.1 SnoaL-like domain-containing protein [Jiangella alba]